MASCNGVALLLLALFNGYETEDRANCAPLFDANRVTCQERAIARDVDTTSEMSASQHRTAYLLSTTVHPKNCGG